MPINYIQHARRGSKSINPLKSSDTTADRLSPGKATRNHSPRSPLATNYILAEPFLFCVQLCWENFLRASSQRNIISIAGDLELVLRRHVHNVYLHVRITRSAGRKTKLAIPNQTLNASAVFTTFRNLSSSCVTMCVRQASTTCQFLKVHSTTRNTNHSARTSYHKGSSVWIKQHNCLWHDKASHVTLKRTFTHSNRLRTHCGQPDDRLAFEPARWLCPFLP